MNDFSGTYIVLLNYRGWRDTLACLESLGNAMQRGAKVVVCDNDSGDGSIDNLCQWAAGFRRAGKSGHPRLDRLLDHSDWRPACQRMTRQQAEIGACRKDAQLYLVDNAANLGFAAGNNVGLRLALAQEDMTHVWILNNDTLVEPDCLEKMHARLAGHGRPAACGSVIHFFDRPEIIQCIGGNRFDHDRARAMESEGRYEPEAAMTPVKEVEARIAYLSGCSTLLPREFLETVGLMSEDYFLYYEEIDWFTRARGRFDLLIAADAHLYHREGGSIGSSSWHRPPSLLSDRQMFRSRLIYVARHAPQARWRCAVANWMDVGKRIVRGQFRNALAVSQVLLRGPASA